MASANERRGQPGEERGSCGARERTSGKMTLGDKRLQARVVAASAAGSCGRRWSHAGRTLNLAPHIRRGRELTLARRTGEMSYKMRSVPCIRLQDQGVTP